jgi:transposase-like protein
MVNPMSQKWRKYSPEFRRDVLEKMKTCPNISELARELGVRRKWLYAWKKRALAGQPEQAPAEAPTPAALGALGALGSKTSVPARPLKINNLQPNQPAPKPAPH